MRNIEIDSLETYVKIVKDLKSEVEDLIANPSKDLNGLAKAWRKLYGRYYDYHTYASLNFSLSLGRICNNPHNSACVKCCNESCARYWWEILNNELSDVISEGEYDAGDSRIRELCEELGVSLVEYSDYEDEVSDDVLIKKAVRDRETGDLYYISLRANFGGFPYLVYSKVNGDGTKPDYFKYTKLYSPNKVYSGKVTEGDIKQLLISKFVI